MKALIYLIITTPITSLAVNVFSTSLQVGFRTSRYYWSSRTLKKRCRYVMSITEEEGAPMFNVRCIEPGLDDQVRSKLWFIS